MGYRLLVDLEALAVLDAIPKRVRARLVEHFIRLRATPDRYSDYHEHDRTGRIKMTPDLYSFRNSLIIVALAARWQAGALDLNPLGGYKRPMNNIILVVGSRSAVEV